jgi:uncharacterized protein (TIGR02444 family)
MPRAEDPLASVSPYPALWDFAVFIYGLPDVATACLTLQDRGGADVNMLLFALWNARCGRRLSPEQVASAADLVRPWQDAVVRPLRTLRRALKNQHFSLEPAAVSTFRESVKNVELAAERLQLEMLATAVMPATSDLPLPVLARNNLDAYLGGLRLVPNPAATHVLLRAFAQAVGQDRDGR